MRTSFAGPAGMACVVLLAVAPCVEAETATDGAAEALARRSGFPGGVCVVLGSADAEAALGAAKSGRFVVHALYDDAARLHAARNAIDARSVYGQVSADLWQGGRLPYAENLVNVLAMTEPVTFPWTSG